MMHLIAQNPLEAVRDHLDKGGSLYTPFVTILVLLAVAGALLIVQRLQQRRVAKPALNDPARLFSSILGKVGLNVMQRDLLRRIATDLRLPHPTVMLLSPEIFHDHIQQWQTLREERGAGTSASTEPLHEVAEVLFGPEAAKPTRRSRSAHVAKP